jgi:hypothetical protein
MPARKTVDVKPSTAPFASAWESKVQHLTPSKLARKASRPSALRLSLGLSCREMGDLLGDLGGHAYDRTAVCKYEKALNGRYAARHGHSRFMRATYRALIISYVQWTSRGRYTARVAMTGPHAHKWKVTLLKVRASRKARTTEGA